MSGKLRTVATNRGRPKTPKPLVQINLYAPPELAAWLDRQASRHRRTRSNMAVTFLEQVRASTRKEHL